MRRLLALAVAVLCVFGVAACGSSDDKDSGSSGSSGTASTTASEGSGGRRFKIGMANFTLGAPYFIGISKTVERDGQRAGNEVLVTDAKGDAAALTSNVEDLLAQGVDGIVISGGPLEAAPAALNAIKQKGIPVVLVDRKFQSGDYTSWVGPDNEAIGRQDGEYISERLGGSGKVAIIRGGPADNSIGLARTEGVRSVLEGAGIELVVAPDFGEWSSDGGLRVMENLLAKNKDLDAVFCENDSMCLGAQKAIRDAGKSEQIFIAGVDGQKEALAEIRRGGNYEVTGLNDAVTMGDAAFERLIELLDGGQAEKDTVVPSPQITRANVDDYYDPNSEF
ncbi:substrate-binding domain-containing protein [Conexibacter sp. JD483]|uniref:substrate-binding domain-containing protein n=1 Tax=unclassified Conexibacter TaxID=2627773 RepID=UPI00271A80B3|nr:MULTISPECIES: substrate-binding domain-containing protein [unclassified Conexibacter]MDO8187303.1 substrate-binding domain-containing protein [Conexibacter sp. CPCC 205706]MDO8198912.1 substrate-binding domain-containing protein [Conexibacter sp. CPCC 205762]MDR9370651.1 substrate-binding domain-containing protein [Conexibacter sp. JD483]